MRRSRGQADQHVYSGFNLRREAAPHATLSPQPQSPFGKSFNLRREAAPHATSSNTLASDSLISVSISDEKPLHMRLGELLLEAKEDAMFQSQTRSRSTCDKICSCRRNAI